MQDRDSDRRAIVDLVNDWVMWRDMGDFERMRGVWHDDGRIQTTWRQGTADEFVRATRETFEKGITILHTLGGITVDVAGDRAISISKATVSQRATVDGVLCDVTCMARHYDFWERRAGRWGLVMREGIYDKDWLVPLEPGRSVPLDQSLLAQLPENYRHLAYLQTRIGFDVKRDMPCLRGPEVQALYARGAAWLRGEG